MEPRIQYAQAADGVSIAYWTLGEGMPLVHMPGSLFTHGQLEWNIPEYRGWHERLAQKRKLIRYDNRGSGLSDRDVTDYSVDALLLDLEAVTDHLGLETFALFGQVTLMPVAIAYAARHPERVSRLILWCAWMRYSDFPPGFQTLLEVADKDWGLFTETLAHATFGWSSGEEGRRWAAFMRECTTPEAVARAVGALREVDVTDLLPQVSSPTLVLHRRQVAFAPVDVARRLASRIPEARLAILEGSSPTVWLGDTEAMARAIDEFLDDSDEAAEKGEPGAVHTILFTDMESSTALTQRLGDAKAQELVRAHNAIVREALKSHGGSEIKHTGDGIMASFSSASGALECAVAIQQAVATHVEVHPEVPLAVRIGLNAGEPVAEDQDLFGTVVQLARRICDQAEPGQILVPEGVRHLVAGKGFLFADQGDVALRGFEDPVRLYEVRWRR